MCLIPWWKGLEVPEWKHSNKHLSQILTKSQHWLRWEWWATAPSLQHDPERNFGVQTRQWRDWDELWDLRGWEKRDYIWSEPFTIPSQRRHFWPLCLEVSRDPLHPCQPTYSGWKMNSRVCGLFLLWEPCDRIGLHYFSWYNWAL